MKKSQSTVNRYAFDLHIYTEHYLDYYRGTARTVIVRADSGQTVQFPASLLQKHVTTEGIHGQFVLLCDENNKVIELQKLTEPPAPGGYNSPTDGYA